MEVLQKIDRLKSSNPFTTRVIIACALFQVGLGLAIASGVVFHLHPELTWSRIIHLFRVWDGQHYIYLAENGYQTSGFAANLIAFYPLYPLLIWAASSLGSDTHISAIFITIVASFMGHVVFALYLMEIGCDRWKTWRILTLLFLTPITVYFSVIYTEALFLLETAMCLLMLRKEQYKWAAISGLCASATRLFGVLLVIPYIAHFLETKQLVTKWRSLLWVCLIPLGYVIYLCINWQLFGDIFYHRNVLQSYWHKTAVSPISQYVHHFKWMFIQKRNIEFFTYRVDIFMTLITPLIVVLYGGLKFVKKTCLGWGEITWTLSQWAIVASQSFWLSSARYVLLILPLYIMVEELSWTWWRFGYFLVLSVATGVALYGISLFSQGAWLY